MSKINYLDYFKAGAVMGLVYYLLIITIAQVIFVKFYSLDVLRTLMDAFGYGAVIAASIIAIIANGILLIGGRWLVKVFKHKNKLLFWSFFWASMISAVLNFTISTIITKLIFGIISAYIGAWISVKILTFIYKKLKWRLPQ